MKLKGILYVGIVLMLIMVPVAYAYTDPVSITIIWQFLASAAVGILFFAKRIKLWIISKLNANNKK